MTPRSIAALSFAAALLCGAALPIDSATARDDVYVAQGRGRGNDNPGRGGGNDRGRGNDQGRDDDRGNDRGRSVEKHFVDNDRTVIRQYFASPPGGRCPPGLAKKNNGCQPPGQAKNWSVGQRLSRDVQYYDLDRDLLRRLTPAPTGYRYVRVGTDVLLLSLATSLVVDALTGF